MVYGWEATIRPAKSSLDLAWAAQQKPPIAGHYDPRQLCIQYTDGK